MLPAFAEGEIAYVDLQRALLETNEGKQAKQSSNEECASKQLDERQQQLKTLQQNPESQRAFMKEDVRRQETEFAQQLRELQMTYANLQRSWR